MEAFIVKRSGDSKIITKPFCFTTHCEYSGIPALENEKVSSYMFQTTGITHDCKISNEVVTST